MSHPSVHADVLVLGSGLAGMWYALKAAEYGSVIMVTKTVTTESNTSYAQGGIAAVWSDEDSIERHAQDTLVAGDGLCRPEAVECTVREGPDRVRELIDLGVGFTRRLDDPSSYDLHQEGGHSFRRILHAEDLTGREVVRALVDACIAHPNIEILEHHLAVDLITEQWLSRRAGRIPSGDDIVRGAYVLNVAKGEVGVIAAKIVVLATGGAGKVYLYTTNPNIATGDGYAMAWRAGAEMSNMEFVQFHPTCLYHQDVHHFLISEALRGEGGRLVRPDGTEFMEQYHPLKELAPRDIVARAIDSELKREGLDCVFLDMSHFNRSEVQRRFPNIDAKLMSLGIDMTSDPIPVVPAAHYMCGGVGTDLMGETSIQNLFAIGEVSCTGLHGANRLASNSLLEAMVFANRGVAAAVSRLNEAPVLGDLPEWDAGSAVDSDEQVVIQQTWEEIRRFMWNYVGIVRTHRRLERAQNRIELVRKEIQAYYWDFKLTADLVELRNLVDVADVIIQSALSRQESRGLHYVQDFPKADPRFLSDTRLRRRL